MMLLTHNTALLSAVIASLSLGNAGGLLEAGPASPRSGQGKYGKHRHRSTSKYMPHQGERECRRRRKQMCTGEFAR